MTPLLLPCPCSPLELRWFYLSHFVCPGRRPSVSLFPVLLASLLDSLCPGATVGRDVSLLFLPISWAWHLGQPWLWLTVFSLLLPPSSLWVTSASMGTMSKRSLFLDQACSGLCLYVPLVISVLYPSRVLSPLTVPTSSISHADSTTSCPFVYFISLLVMLTCFFHCGKKTHIIYHLNRI